MTLSDVVSWVKANTPVGDGISAGRINGNKDRYIGVYNRRTTGKQRICIGGATNTQYQRKDISILVHWTTSPTAAEAKAQKIYKLLYGRSGIVMGKTAVISVDPGAAPVPVGADERGIAEYVIEATIWHERNDLDG